MSILHVAIEYVLSYDRRKLDKIASSYLDINERIGAYREDIKRMAYEQIVRA
jgi:hypothetical protein